MNWVNAIISMILIFFLLAVGLSTMPMCGCRSKSSEAAVRAECIALKSAVLNYYAEMGDFPYSGPQENDVSLNAEELLPILSGNNERGVKYFGKKVLSHPFGGNYQIKIDLNYDGRIEVKGIIYEQDVVVFSTGEDGELLISESQ